MSAFNSEQASMTAALASFISMLSSGMGMDCRASASSDGVGKLFSVRKALTLAVSLAMSEESSRILCVEAIVSRCAQIRDGLVGQRIDLDGAPV
jgi:hypothetical protein